MATPLTLDSARRNDGTFVLTAAGEIDMSNIAAFNDSLAAAISESAGSGTALTVDLSAVGYLDSTAITALFSNADHIAILAHPPHLMDVFSVSGLTELVTIEAAPAQRPSVVGGGEDVTSTTGDSRAGPRGRGCPTSPAMPARRRSGRSWRHANADRCRTSRRTR